MKIIKEENKDKDRSKKRLHKGTIKSELLLMKRLIK